MTTSQKMSSVSKFSKVNNVCVDKLTSELDDIEQVKLRLVAPDATNNSQWFLKPDLVVHPRYAVSERKLSPLNLNGNLVTHRKMLKIREEKEKVVERSICGLPEYYQSFKDRLKIKETLQSDRDKNALVRQKSKLVGRRNLPSVFKSSNENKIYTT